MPTATTFDSTRDITPAQAAVLASVAELTVRRWIKAGELPARLVLGRVVIAVDDLEKYLSAGSVEPKPAAG